jgi:hypothetical protein
MLVVVMILAPSVLLLCWLVVWAHRFSWNTQTAGDSTEYEYVAQIPAACGDPADAVRASSIPAAID